MKETILELQNVEKSFGNLAVLKGIDFFMKQGEKLVIVGPSGSGKSTILRCINRLETFEHGHIFYKNESIERLKPSHLRSEVGMVFQRFNIFSHMNVLENLIEAPIHVKKIPRQKAIEHALILLETVGLFDKRNAMPSQLSGGQLQRVGIARALAMEPSLLLFDEPTSALDPELVGEVLQVMKKIAHTGTSMIVVTHEMAFAKEVADRILFMDGGTILQDAPPDVFFSQPCNDRVRNFIAKVGFAQIS
ncbi:MAG: amino acid ABC transporter ATP-binding protein [Sphaerochaeta sp.]